MYLWSLHAIWKFLTTSQYIELRIIKYTYLLLGWKAGLKIIHTSATIHHDLMPVNHHFWDTANQARLSHQVNLVTTCYFGWVKGLLMDFYLAKIFDFGRSLKEVIFQNNARQQYLWNYLHSVTEELALLDRYKSFSSWVRRASLPNI